MIVLLIHIVVCTLRIYTIIVGKYVDMKKEQAIKEKEAQRVETGIPTYLYTAYNALMTTIFPSVFPGYA